MASTSPTNEPKKSRFRRGSSGGATKADGASSTRGEAKEPGRSAQFRQVFETARANDPALLAWMIGAFALVFVLLLIIGFSIGHPIYLGIIGVLLGVLAALLVLARRANTAIYKSISGQPGASVAVMSSLRKGWFVEQEPVGVDMGRNIFQSDAPKAMIAAIGAVVHKNMKPKEAFEMFNSLKAKG